MKYACYCTILSVSTLIFLKSSTMLRNEDGLIVINGLRCQLGIVMFNLLDDKDELFCPVVQILIGGCKLNPSPKIIFHSTHQLNIILLIKENIVHVN